MAYLSVSSFSLHSELGPLQFEHRSGDGSLETVVYDFPRKHTLEEFAVLARDRIGVNVIELCQVQFDSNEAWRIDQLSVTLEKEGVSVLTVPIDIGDLGVANSEWRKEDEARIIPWFDIAHRLGAQFVRVNAGLPGSTVVADARAGLVASLKRLGVEAANRGMKLLIENHGGSSSDSEYVLALCQEVGMDLLGVLLDLGNFEPLVTVSQARFSDPDYDDKGLDLEPLYKHVRRLAPVASLVHAKSVDPASDGAALPDLPRALSIVAEAGYKGSISIEWEGQLGDPWERTAAIAEQVRAAFPHLS